MTEQSTRLKELITGPDLLIMPGAFDPMSARLIERSGFDAVQCSGLGMTAVHLGKPDYSMLSMSDMVAISQKIADAVDIPVMGDADTGFGNAVNAHYTVREFERAGVAGINLEDQVMPKRCGHLDGKTVIDFDEATTKIRAAADARRDPDFVLNARTDALPTEGIDGVIRRGNAYLEAGATMVFVDGITSREAISAAVKGIDGPVGINIVEGGKSPKRLTFTELHDLGVARVSLPGALMGAALGGMQEALRRIRRDDGTWNLGEISVPFLDAFELIGMNEVFELEERYLRPLAERTASTAAEGPTA